MERTMSSVAFLPMYSVRGTNVDADTLWHCLRDSLASHGIEAPEQVSHFEPRLKGWLHPELILGQTCGLPYITRLCGSVELVGTPDYGVEGCPPGFYHSTLVVSSADTRKHLSEFVGGTLAVNRGDSQSGYAAIMLASAPFARAGRFFQRAVHSGSHAASMQLVAKGFADIAAIDSVTWRMHRQFDPVTSGLKPIGTTEPTPGLPFIAAAGKADAKLFGAVRAGIAALPDATRQAFGLRDVVPFGKQHYEVIRANLARAEAVHTLPEMEEVLLSLPGVRENGSLQPWRSYTGHLHGIGRNTTLVRSGLELVLWFQQGRGRQVF
jgi:ABC-type phosphate/phosphonate transport system substrate-binding protein